MSLRSHPLPIEPVQAELPPDVEAQLRAGIEACERGETMRLTAQEAEHYLETGELPERVERWAASPD
jgi:hypothetical protein